MRPFPPSSRRARRLAFAAWSAITFGLLRRTAERYDRALARERALRRAIAALLAAPDRDAVLAAGLKAVPELLGPGTPAAITITDGHRVIVKGDAGSDPLRIALRGREPQGVLAVGGRAPRDQESRALLEVFAGELAMALEAAGLAQRLARRDADTWYRSLIDNAADVITVLNRDGTIRFQTPSIEDVLGHSAEALAGTRIIEHVHPDDRDWVAAHYRRLLGRPGPSGEVLARWLHRDGGFRWVESRAANLLHDRAVDGIVINSRDVTDCIALQEQLSHRAFHDGLTGLANHALFVDRLDHALYSGRAAAEARRPHPRPRRLQEGQRLAGPPGR
jgi:PAS domain S-box-containing protein